MCAAVRRAHISFCRLTEARCVEHTSGDGRSWKVGGAKMARSDKVKREIYTRELGGRHTNLYNSKIGRYEDRKRLRRL